MRPPIHRNAHSATLLLLALSAAAQTPRATLDEPPTGCPQSPVTPPPGPITANDSVTLQRTECDRCPIYALRIQGNGNVTWTGHRHVAVIGQATTQIDPTAARQLIERFRTPAFFSLCSSYTSLFDHAARVILTASISGHHPGVSNQGGAAPSFVRDLETAIERTANVHQFLHGDPSTEPIYYLQSENTTKPGWTPLIEATRAYSTAPLEQLLRTKPDLNAPDSSGWPPLFYAASATSQAAAKVYLLLRAGANPRHVSPTGDTLLHALATQRHFDPQLARLTGHLNAQNRDGVTPLMILAALFHPEPIRQALAAGADPALRDRQGRTALDYLNLTACGHRPLRGMHRHPGSPPPTCTVPTFKDFPEGRDAQRLLTPPSP